MEDDVPPPATGSGSRLGGAVIVIAGDHPSSNSLFLAATG